MIKKLFIIIFFSNLLVSLSFARESIVGYNYINTFLNLSSFSHAGNVMDTVLTTTRYRIPAEDLTFTITGKTYFCSGNDALSVTSTGVPDFPNDVSIQWTKDGADISGATSKDYQATAGGAYRVRVTVNGVVYQTPDFDVASGPTADFSFSPSQASPACSNIPVVFTNQSTGYNLTYTWDFGDPNSATNASADASPSHTFIGTTGNGPQNFTVKLYVTDGNGCQAIPANKIVTTNQLPRLDFTTSTADCSNLPVQFTDQSGGPVTNYSWNFGDPNSASNTSSEASPTHVFTGTPGDGTQDFNVMLSAKNSNGCQNSVTKTVTVKQMPKADFRFTPNTNNACSNVPIVFTDQSTGSNLTYSWDFGDPNSIPAGESNTSTSANPTHTFIGTNGNLPQSFTVTLTVKNNNGCTSVITKTVITKQIPDVEVADAVNIFSPFSNCENNPSLSNPNYTLTLSNASKNPAIISSYSIDWGDNTTANNISFPITHAYTQLGTFPLVVTAKGINGCNNSFSHNVVNLSNPAGGLATNGNTSGLSAPAVIPFTISNWENNSPGTTYTLDFGDGKSSTFTQPLTSDVVNHTYTTSSCPGTFTATLTVSNSCSSTPYTAGNIKISIQPTAAFTAGPNPGCAGKEICFTNTTVSGYNYNCSQTITNTWNFGDPGSSDNISHNASPCHTYANPGTYTVTLTAENSCGSSTFTQQVCVNPQPVPSFTTDAVNNEGCVPLTVNAINHTSTANSCTPATYSWSVSSYAPTNCGTARSESWEWANNTTAASENPSFLFKAPGTYTITLSVTNPCGTFSTSQSVVVKKVPTVSLPAIPASCGQATINPVATVTNCGSNTLAYSWSFGAGIPATSTDANPMGISFSTPGNHAVSLAVTNECGTTTATENITVNPLPAAYHITGGGAYCTGSSGVPVGLDNSQIGTSYQLQLNGNNSGIAKAGTGSAISFGNQTSYGTYTVIATNTTTLCTQSMTGSVTIIVNPLPAVYTVTGGGAYCAGGSGVAAGLGNSQTGVNYQLYNGTTAVGAAIAGSGAAINFGNQTASGTYTVIATNTSTSCSQPMNGSILISVNPLPVVYTVTGGGSYCSGNPGLPVGLNNSQRGVNYQLYNGAITVGSAIGGTGTAISFGNQTAAGIYTVVATNTSTSCTQTMTGNAVITVNALPTVLVTNPAAACSPAGVDLTALSVTLGSTGNLAYAYFTNLNGTIVLSVPNAVTQSGTYYIKGTDGNNCSVIKPVVVKINDLPTAYNVTGGGSYCAGGSGLPVTLSGSQIGVSYQLLLNGSTSVGNAVTGTGTTLNFGNQIQEGGYTVTATNTNTSCTQAMNGAATIAISTLKVPSVSIMASATTICKGAPVTFTATSTNGGSAPSYQWLKNGNNAGTNSATYSDAGLNNNDIITCVLTPVNACITTPTATSNPITMVVNAIPTITNVIAGAVCGNGPVTLRATASGGTVNWYTMPAGGSSVENGNNYITPNLSSSTAYYVDATANGCTTSNRASVIATVNSLPSAMVGSDQTICSGNSVQIGAAAIGGNTYLWTSNPDGFHSVLSNPSVSPSVTTIYTLQETVTATGCNRSNNITITVNPTPNISGSSSTNPATCLGSDGTITLNGLFVTTNFTLNYTYNNIPVTKMVSSDASGNIIINGLRAGLYSQIQVSTMNGCPSNIITSITLSDPTPPPAPTAANNAPLCSGNTLNLTASTIPGASYHWIFPDGSVSDLQNPVIPDVTTVFNGNYSVKATVNNCTSSAATTNVIVNPIPDVKAIPSNETICSNTATGISLNSTITGTEPGTTFDWTIINNSNINGAGSGVGNLIGQTLINTSSSPQTVTYVITPAYLNDNKSCTGSSVNVDITVNPTPTLTISSSEKTICSNTLTGIELSTTVPGTVFNWIAGNNVNITGVGNGSGNSNANGIYLIDQHLINTGSSPQTVTYTITPSYSNNGLTCTGSPKTVVITVNPSPGVQFSRADETICSGSNSSVVNLNSATASAQFNWVINNPSVGVTGVVLSGTDVIQAQTIINNTAAPVTIYYTATAKTNDVNACPGNSSIYSITVNPVPDVIADPTSQTICSNTAMGINLSTTVPETSFSWTVSANPNITGSSPGSGTSIVQTLVNTSAFVQTVDYTITPNFSKNGTNCQGTPVTVTITVNPSPVLVGNLTQSPLCTNQLFSYTPSSLTPGTGFFWTREAIDGIINPAANGSGEISEVLLNTSTAPVAVPYVYTLSANGCSNPQIITETINPNAKSSFAADTLISCAPYNLPDHISVIRYPEANDETRYKWLANNVLIGSGLQIPTYAITQTADTVALSLVAVSKYGCIDDTMQKIIYTIQQPVPGFTMSTHKGCGPASVIFQNTTTPLNVINNTSYFWDFGNGITSGEVQPGTIIFDAAANFKDTTYYITLKAITPCETLTHLDSVKVRPWPKALFTPSATVGCAPFNVSFSNNSLGADYLGNGMTYYWSYGDSTFDTTANLNSVSHIYHNASQQIDTFYVKLVAVNECQKDSIQYNIVVFPNTVKPALIVNGNEKFGCAPHTVHFFNNSTGANSFIFNFNDGTTHASVKSPDSVVHVFYDPGTYTVVMDATNGCSDTSATATVVVYPSIPVPAFSVNPVNCLSDSVLFTNTTDTSLINSILWDLGDGYTSNSFQLKHKYVLPGFYNINVTDSKTYSSGVTCTSSGNQLIQVIANPAVVFTSNDNNLNCSPFNYTVNTTPSLAGSAEWHFSDPYSTDTTAIGFTASHLFTRAGTYKVTLKATNQNGCSDTSSQYVRITESPAAGFSYEDSVICSKGANSKTITFTNTTTYGGSAVIAYEWRVNGILKSTSNKSFTYTFQTQPAEVLPKSFTVTLTAVSSVGCSDTKTATIAFVPYPEDSIVLSQSTVCGNSIITATDSGSVADVRKWTWTSATMNSPALILSSDTTSVISVRMPSNNTQKYIDYDINLWLMNGNSCPDSTVKTIRLYPKPKVDFSLKDTLCANADYGFLNTSDPYNGEPAGSMQFNWYVRKYNAFRDTVFTNYSNDLNPVFNFTNTGVKDSIYFVTLVGFSQHGCVDSVMRKVVVHPSTIADFTSSPAISCTPMTLFVLSNHSVNAGSFAWYINGQLYSTATIPADTVLTESGKRYELKLVASNNYGCSADSLITTVTAFTAPVAKFSMFPSTSCSGSLSSHFYNQSTASGTTLNNWLWDFGDGTSSNLQNPNHQYTLPGNYVISLSVQDGRGCFPDSPATQTVIVYGKPQADFYAANVCIGDSVVFYNRSLLGYGSETFDKVIWDFGDGTTSQLFSPKHFYKGAGVYNISLIVLSNNSCVADTLIKSVTVYGKPVADFKWNINCVNTPVNFTNLSTPGLEETSLSSSLWNFGNGTTSNQFNPSITFSNDGQYRVSLQVNNAICVNLSDTISKVININSPRNGQTYPRVEATYGNSQSFHALSGGVSYNWSPVTGLNSTTVQDPVALYNLTDPNDINYSIFIIDSSGCDITDHQEVFIFKKPAIYAPSALIVNGNALLNRRFLPHYIDISRLIYFRILDRWGVEQFSTSDMTRYWDGNDKKGNPLPMATYIWIAVGVDVNGNQVIGKGDVTLVRNNQ